MRWTHGNAMVATGSPFEPVEFNDRLIPVPQCNNVYIFPGVGLGALTVKAKAVTDGMFAAAAEALAAQVSEQDLARGLIYPPLADLRKISRVIAAAVAASAVGGGVGTPMSQDEIDAELDREIWDLNYPILQPV
jgi:malate dehydrogenase (oxaloacetate-decarboxylating)